VPLPVPDLHDDVVALRPPRTGDVPAITAAAQDPDIYRFTMVPTPYGEAINPDQTVPSIPATSANMTVTPHPNGGGSPLVEVALLGIVVFAVIAGTSFFLFFRIR